LPWAALFGLHLRICHLRAFDIGYAKPGLRIMLTFIPVIGFFQWLAIGCIPTGGKLPENYPS
jgi:hypothetical protein